MFMQLLKNSGHGEKFRADILKSGIAGYNKILAADKVGEKPIYRPKEWEAAARRLQKRQKKKNWNWKSCIFVPSTPGSELKKLMQEKEEQMRAGVASPGRSK
jgi:hypothetical protein